MPNTGLIPSEFLLPAGADMQKWSVVACDQFTSEPEYWRRAEAFVGSQPSALHAILPEIYLNRPDTAKRIDKLNETMRNYIRQGLFVKHTGYVYIERLLNSGITRRGLVGMIDLEEYSFAPKSDAAIRSTEGTVAERIPPRVAIRKDAPLEFPHIILLFDDPEMTVLGPCVNRKDSFELLYDFELMENGGRIAGRLLDSEEELRIRDAFAALNPDSGMRFAVGDGNHSLAAAKTCYEELKKTLEPAEALSHPARYALVEAVNLHDPAMEFEPIHRIVFDVDPNLLLSELTAQYGKEGDDRTSHTISVIAEGTRKEVTMKNTGYTLPCSALQVFLDEYLSRYGGSIDYIHGDHTVEMLSAKPGNVGFLLPAISKSDFFAAVSRDGVFPRKTFSCGNAEDKRYYLECRKITL